MNYNIFSHNEIEKSVVRGTGQVQLQFSGNPSCQRIYRRTENRNQQTKPPKSIRISISRQPSQYLTLRNSNNQGRIKERFIRALGNDVRNYLNNRVLNIFTNDEIHPRPRFRSIQPRGNLCSIIFGRSTHNHNVSPIHSYNVKAPWISDSPSTERIIPIVTKRYISEFTSSSAKKSPSTSVSKDPISFSTDNDEKSVCITRTIQLPIKSSLPTPIYSAPVYSANDRDAKNTIPSTSTDYVRSIPTKKNSLKYNDFNDNSLKYRSVSNLVDRFADMAKDISSPDQQRRRTTFNDDNKVTGKRVSSKYSGDSKLRETRKDNITITSSNKLIPQFYFPYGQPLIKDVSKQEQKITKLKQLFERKQSNTLIFSDFTEVMKILDLPLYWKSALFRAIGTKKKETVQFDSLLNLWKKTITTYHDSASRFFYLLSFNRNQDYLEPCDWENLILDVVNTHPGLRFLKEAKEFISRYCKTVIARIYFVVNRTLSDRITLKELRNSNLMQVIEDLEKEDDINKFTEYFSYEHFYVIYCKFWEIDTDHDLFVSREDLYQHNQNAISHRVIDRIFSGAVTSCSEIRKGLMSYYEFVWFLIAEEDKRSRSSIEYWFRCLDTDGDGYISMYELEYFYEEQMQRMEMYGFEFMQFEDVMCQMLDMIKPVDRTKIRLMDLKKCKLVNIFFDTFINTEKHIEHDQRDPFASFKDPDENGVTDWVRFASEEYENLIADEQVHSYSDDQQIYEAGDDVENNLEDSNCIAEDSSPSTIQKTPQLINTSTL